MKPGDILKLEGRSYKVVEEIGYGSYGVVYKCRGKKGQKVAIKEIPNLDELDGVRSYIIREVSILREMDHANIVKLLDVHISGTSSYLIFEYLGADLENFIDMSPRTATDSVLRKKLLQQILCGVAYCHSHNILHQDLNPSNVLIDKRKEIVKLADFGLARTTAAPAEAYSVKIGTLMYMAPEILFGSGKFSTASDMWSVGCIFGEMVNRTCIFPHRNTTKQLSLIFSILGTPNERTWPGVTSLYDGLPSLPQYNPKDLAQEFNGLEPAGVNLLSRMLCLDPSKRITADDALQHSYFKEDV